MNSACEDAKTRSMNAKELSAVVVDTAFQIHRDIGPGLLESVYQKVLVAVLRHIVNNHTETTSSLLRINHCTPSRLRDFA